MRLNITQAAIERVVDEYIQIKSDRKNPPSGYLAEYFGGKYFALIETFGILTGQDWSSAAKMLAQRAAARVKA